jgi:DNA (cytosine-5)-methyltransferase 1
MEIVEKLNPRAIVLENVPGFISLYGGKAKEELINSLVKMDYSVTYKVLLAADYGVPQMRKRVIFIGLKNTKSKFTFPDPTHSPKNSLFSEFKSYVTCEDAISDLPPLSLQGETGEEIQEYHTSPQNEYQQVMRRNSTRIINHVGTNHTDKTREIISMVPDGGNYKDLPDAFKNSRNFHVAWTRFRSDLPAPTIDTGHRHHFHYKWNRVPTVREAARIQSFPDVFEFIGNKTQQNRQVGNAVPPLLAKAIADKLKEYL